jgi:hypothetical protein
MPYIGNIVQDFSVNTAMLNTDSVTSIKIDDGTIVNADINDSAAIAMSKLALSITNSEVNASAAIAGTKISPDFGSQVITTTGKVQAGDDVEVVVSSGDAFILTKGGTNQGHLVKKADNTTVAGITNGGAVSGGVDDAAVFAPAGDLKLMAGGNNVNSNLIVDVTSSGIDVTGAITGTADMTIDTTTFHVDASDNRVGIGTTSPTGILEIDSSSTTEQLMFDVSGTNYARIGHNTSGGSALFDIRSEGHARILTNGNNTAIFIKNNQNVGIGTTSPLKKLHLVDAGDVALMLQTTNANNDAEIWEVGCGANSSSNADLIFRTRLNDGSGGDERVRMTQGGNLEVSGSQLKVQNTGNVNLLAGSTNAGGAALVLDGDSDGNGSGADYAYIEHDTSGNLNIVQDNPAGGGKIDFFTAGVARVSMQSDKFRPANNEGMTLGTSGLRWGNVFTSGILFGGDTAAANTLDDYEEGTWTPSVSGTTSNLGSTTGRAFMYRKIGSVVFFTFDFFQENNNMSISSSVVIDGLPFDSPNLPNNFLSNVSIGSIGTSGNSDNVKNYINNSAKIFILTAVSGSRHFSGQGFYFVA